MGEGALKPFRVLVAEDEDTLASAITAAVTTENLDVVGRARNGAEAVELAKTLSPDLVLMDVDMPVMDGLEATRRILAADGRTRVLIVSGSDVEAHTDIARHVGAVGFVPKSAIVDDLARIVRCIAAAD